MAKRPAKQASTAARAKPARKPRAASSPEPARPPGRPEWQPTDEQRAQVEKWIGGGSTEIQIARRLHIDPKTLRKHCRDELDCGIDKANSTVAGALFAKATGEGPGSVTAAIFWLKTRAGWKETIRVEPTPTEGLSDSELSTALETVGALLAGASGAESGPGEGEGDA